MFCLNDDQMLINQFIRDAPILKLYMPFTSYEDDWVIKFFETDSQGDHQVCTEVNLLINVKALDTWENSNKDTTPVQHLIIRKNYLGKYLLLGDLSHNLS